MCYIPYMRSLPEHLRQYVWTREHHPEPVPPEKRNAVARLMARCRERWQDGEALITLLERLMADEDPRVQLMALKLAFERGWGLPPQAPPEVAGLVAAPMDWSRLRPEDLRYLTELRSRLTEPARLTEPQP